MLSLTHTEIQNSQICIFHGLTLNHPFFFSFQHVLWYYWSRRPTFQCGDHCFAPFFRKQVTWSGKHKNLWNSFPYVTLVVAMKWSEIYCHLTS